MMIDLWSLQNTQTSQCELVGDAFQAARSLTWRQYFCRKTECMPGKQSDVEVIFDHTSFWEVLCLWNPQRETITTNGRSPNRVKSAAVAIQRIIMLMKLSLCLRRVAYRVVVTRQNIIWG